MISHNPTAVYVPVHLWVVGVLSLLWNAAGAYTIIMAQAGKLPTMNPDEIAYYEAQSAWFVIVTDIALVSAIVAAISLLLRSRAAVEMYLLSFIAIVITNTYDLVAGTSRAFANHGALVVTGIIVLLALLQFYYSRKMLKRKVLR